MGKKKDEKEKEKPLEKLTAKELRDMAKDVPDIVGAHGMNKGELISAIKKAKGIAEAPGKQKSGLVRELKQKMKVLKAKQENAIKENNEKMAKIYRKRLIKIKKKTRRIA